jgi:hypothetical protein
LRKRVLLDDGLKILLQSQCLWPPP